MPALIETRSIPRTNHDLDNLEISDILKNIYLARGVTQSKELEAELKNLHPFNLLTNIDKAAELIYQHIENNKNILIIGDFDGDGATSTALAVDFFRHLGLSYKNKINYLVPNRFEYGYGLSVELVHEASKLNPDLIITVDSGIACLAGVKTAKELNIAVVVTDHHLPGESLPEADVIVNPNLKNDEFPSKNLAGVGVIFYVLLAVRAKLRDYNWYSQNNIPETNMAQFLDLVALGTVTDVVPLDSNNRILVKQGLDRIRAGQCRVGISALIKIAKRNFRNLVASDLGFSVGPRLNAAGRLDDMSLGIECLLSDDPMHAFSMAETLDSLNNERKLIERDMKQDALDILNNLDLNNNQLPVALCLYNNNWHQGVIGIVAARIKEKYHRPVIVFAKDNDEYIKGSGRSVEGVHLRDILQNIASTKPELLKKFGGHAMAAGLSIKLNDFEEFNHLFIAEIAKVLNHENIFGRYYTDGILDYTDLSLELAHNLKQAGPWGQHFPEPAFHGEFIVTEQRILASQHLALKVKVINPDYENAKQLYLGSNIDAIIFNCNDEEWFNSKLFKVKLVYKLDINEFNNQKKLQLLIDYLEPLQ